jgi:uncharacterized protein
VEISPFPYQGPLEPDQVRARQPLIADLTERVTEHRVTALLGPRRYGKTSVMRRVAAEVDLAGVLVVWVDLYEVASMADLAARLDTALARAGATDDRVTRLASSLQLRLGVVHVELRRPAAQRPDTLATVHTQLDVLTEVARARPVLVVFDEFSGITRVDGAAGLLRTHLQPHYTQLGLLFAGSAPSMMRTLFSVQQQPFYSQADLIELQPFTTEEVVALVSDGFTSTNRQPGDLGSRIADFACGHPQRTMQAADAAWRLVEPGGRASPATWADGLADLRAGTASGLERLYSSLQPRERDVLRIVAGGGSPFGAAAQLFELSPGAAQTARQSLIDNGHLIRIDSTISLVDPVFADWIRHRFPI